MLTSVTTLLALFALYIFGGEVLRGFTFTMIWGVLIGTYSSIFIASPVLILLGTNRVNAKAVAKAAKAPGLDRLYPARAPSMPMAMAASVLPACRIRVRCWCCQAASTGGGRGRPRRLALRILRRALAERDLIDLMVFGCGEAAALLPPSVRVLSADAQTRLRVDEHGGSGQYL